MWFNKYIGIPYQNKGRDSTGVDCWGLVRLVYSEQYNIDLPSFSTSYENEYRELIQEVIAQYKEGWQQTQEPAQGDIILFKVLGTLSHVGIYLGDNKFMHARQGQGTVVIESTTSREWEKRIVGYFKYTENTNTVLNSAPHPLRTEAFIDQIVPGTTVLELVEKINKKYHIPTEIEANYVIMIDGNPVPESTWTTTTIVAGQKVEYRALAKGNAGRMLLMIAVVVAAAYIAGPGGAAATAESFAAGGAAVTTASTGYLAATTMALNMAGMVLINAIAPIRMPTDNTTDPGSAKSQNLFSGGSNSISKYAAIPVVLGKMRITPPLGAQQFVEFQGSEQSRLNSLLVWGYGPLDISDIQIGANDLSTYADYKIATVPGLSDDNTTLLDDIYGSDITQKILNTQLINISTTYNPDNIPETARNPYTEHQITQKCTSISLAIHFPEGLRAVQTKGEQSGTSHSAPFTAEVAYRLLNDSFNPVTDWSTNTSNIPAGKQYITTAGYNGRYVGDENGAYYTYTNAYRWTRVYISKDNTLVFINGAFTESQYAEPSVAILTDVYGTRYSNLIGTNTPITRLPNIPADAVLAYDICFNGNNLVQTINHLSTTTQGYSGLALTFYSPEYQDEWGGWAPGVEKYANISSGSIVRIGNAPAASITISIGADNQEFNRKKDAFTYLQEFSGLPLGYYEIRIKRTNTSLITPDADAKLLHSAYLYSVTGKTNIKPAVNPPGCALAKTALSILSGNNINGTLEGINGLVHSICLDWDSTTKTWSKRRPTSNPASLFLHVIIHPANAFKLALDGDRINLAELGIWHEYCDAQGFAYNNVLDSQKSILDTLKDIAAAGRASPTLIDGKWSVVIDKLRTAVIQHFTPHNSWGFEGVKTLPRQPDAFRVVFRNEDKAYQEEQIIVPNIGYTEETAAIIEEISLPGITNRTIAFKHARWHLAQLRLRPEIYSLNSDFEYLVCNRGDLVRVSHDVPMWGNSTGRISNQITSTSISIDEPAYLETGKSYNIRIRTAAGVSVLRSLSPITTTQYYSTVTLTASLTALEAAAGNLFMLGELNRESQELIVLTIEPMGNTSARLTLTDYSPAIYSVDTSIEYPIPSYDPKLTQLPEKLIDTITQIPQINVNNIKSDESVLTITSGGQLISNIRVPFNNLKGQSKLTSHIEVQYDFSTNVSDTLQFNKTIDILAGSITLTDVQDSTTYKIRARYISSIGIKGPWSSTVTHTVIGKTSAPSNIATIVSKVDSATGKVQLSWTAVSDLDLSEYEVRVSDSDWGTAGYEFKGSATTCFVNPADAGTAKTFYVKAIDVVGNYSDIATSTSITITKPTTPTITTTAATVFNKISRTNSNAKLNWTAGTIVSNNLNIATYEISLTYTVDATPVVVQTKINAFNWETDVNWSGVASFKVRSIDILNNVSDWSNILTFTPSLPNTVGTSTTSISGTDIYLDWEDVETTSLPVIGYEIRVADDNNWGGTGALWKGSVSNAALSLVGKTPGTLTWYIKAYDSVNKYSSTATSVSYIYTKPPTPIITTTAATVFNKVSLTNSNAKFTWIAASGIPNNLDIDTYEINLAYGSTTIQTKIKAFSWETTVDWSSAAIFKVRSIDVLGNVSDWSTVLEFTPSVPNTVAADAIVSTIISGTDIYLDWEDVETTSLPVIGYEIRNTDSNWGGTGALWKGSVSNATLSLVGKTPGTITWYIKAYDSVGKYSDTAKSVSYIYRNPTTPTITTTALTVFNKTSRTNSNAKFNWTAGSIVVNGLDIDTYEVNLTYTSPIADTIQTKTKTFSWETAVTWSNIAIFKVRSIDVLGNASDWSIILDFITELPNTVGTVTTNISGTDIYLDWEDVAITSLPVIGYEVRTSDTNWGSTGSVWKGSVSNVTLSLIGKTAGTHTWYVKAYDSLGSYSNIATSVNYTITAPIAPVIDTPLFQDTSLTNASVTLTWSAVTPLFGLYGYEVTYDTNTIITKSNTITIPASWLGDKTISVKTIDNLITSTTDNKSVAGIRIITVRKPDPIPASFYQAQVIDNTVLLKWVLPAVTTLPISGVRIKRGGTSWATAELIGDKTGTFTSFSELSKDTYIYRIAVIDTDNNESDSISLTAEVSQPPNYVFNKYIQSTFTTVANISTVSKVNAYVDNNAVVLPVNLLETWEGHYIAKNWDTPQAQIDAGYPVYIQPGLGTGSYEEIFDYGVGLASSQITINLGISTIVGTANIKYTISTSKTGAANSYKDVYTNVNSIFSTDFQYIKILIEVTQVTAGAICKLNDLSIRLDSKQKTDSDSVISTLASSGTIANFNKEFIDITAINVTANSASPLITVYDFLDKVKTGNYIVAGGVCTITVPTDEYGVAHNLLTGQKVRVFFTSGLAPSGIYTVTSATTNTYTFNITSSNTDGNASSYPNSMRVYVYNTSGVLQNNVQVSWTVSGY